MAGNRRKVQKPTQKENKGIGTRHCSGIVCPKCGGVTIVTNSKPQPDKGVQGRYRKCVNCGVKLYTEETVSRYYGEDNKASKLSKAKK